jgi:hypothetical protein
LGIELLDVRIKRVNYVEEVRKKVYERMITERQRIAAKYRSEGQGESAKILGEKERDLKVITSEAYRKAQEVIGRADAGAARIYAEAYGRDQEFYRFVRPSEPTRDGGRETLLLLSTDGGFFRYLKDTGRTRPKENKAPHWMSVQRRTTPRGRTLGARGPVDRSTQYQGAGGSRPLPAVSPIETGDRSVGFILPSSCRQVPVGQK